MNNIGLILERLNFGSLGKGQRGEVFFGITKSPELGILTINNESADLLRSSSFALR